MRYLLPVAAALALAAFLVRQGSAVATDGNDQAQLDGNDNPDGADQVNLDTTTSSDTTDDTEQTTWIQDAMNNVKDFINGSDIAEVIEAGPGYCVVRKPDGSVVRRQGSRAWRNNNPGNIEYGAFALAHGAIGTDGRFAVFPTYEQGAACKEALIFDGVNYTGLSLSRAINRYAPPVENNTSMYQATVLAAVGNVDKPMHQYSEPERQAILKAMEKVEGFKVGTVTAVS